MSQKIGKNIAISGRGFNIAMPEREAFNGNRIHDQLTYAQNAENARDFDDDGNEARNTSRHCWGWRDERYLSAQIQIARVAKNDARVLHHVAQHDSHDRFNRLTLWSASGTIAKSQCCEYRAHESRETIQAHHEFIMR